METVANMISGQGAKALPQAVRLLGEALNAEQSSSFSSAELSAVLGQYPAILKSRNGKVVQQGLTHLARLSRAACEGLSPFLPKLLPLVAKHMGDRKAAVRSAAQDAAAGFIAATSADDVVIPLARMTPSQKAPLARAGALELAASAAPTASRASAGAMAPVAARLLSDAHPAVRKASIACIAALHAAQPAETRSQLSRMDISAKQRAAIDATLGGSGGGGASSSPEAARKPKVRALKKRRRGKPFQQARAKKQPSNSEGGAVASAFTTALARANFTAEAVYSERDLERAFVEIIEALSKDPKTSDWRQRIAALRRIGSLVAADAHTLDKFNALLRRAKDVLIKQLEDLRSSVVKAACVTLAFVSQRAGGSLEPLMEFLLPVLTRLTCVTIQVISESADGCARVLLDNTRLTRRAGRKLLELGDAKAGTTRQRAMTYLTRVLVNGISDFSKAAAALEALIKARVSDPSSEVRAATRACCRAYANRYPARESAIRGVLDVGTLKLIDQEERKSDGDALAGTWPKTGLKSGIVKSSARTAGTTAGAASTGAQQHKRSGSVPMPSTRDTAAAMAPEPTPAAAKPARHEATPAQSAAAMAALAAPAAAPPRATPSTTASLLAGLGAPMRVKKRAPAPQPTRKAVVNEKLGGAARVSRPPPTARADAANAGGEDNAQVGEPTATHEPSSAETDTGAASSPSSRQRMRTTTSRKRRVERETPSAQTAAAEDTAAAASVPTESSSHGLHALRRWISEAPRLTDWRDKVKAFESLRSTLTRASGGLNAHVVARLASIFEERLADNHQKVAVVVIGALAQLGVALGPEAFCSYLPRFLPQLLPRLHDARPATRRAAEAAVDAVWDLVRDNVFPQLMRVASAGRSSKNKKARACALVALARLAPRSSAYFQAQPHLAAALNLSLKYMGNTRQAAAPARAPAQAFVGALKTAFADGYAAYAGGVESEIKTRLDDAVVRASSSSKRGSSRSEQDRKHASSARQVRPSSQPRQAWATGSQRRKTKGKSKQASKQPQKPKGRQPFRRKQQQPKPKQQPKQQRQGAQGTAAVTQTAIISAVPDARAQARATTQALLSSLSAPKSAGERRRTLDTLSFMVRPGAKVVTPAAKGGAQNGVWADADCFDALVLGLIETLEGSDAETVASVVSVLLDVMAAHPKQFGRGFDYAELLLMALLSVAREGRRLRRAFPLVERALQVTGSLLEPSRVCAVLVSTVEAELPMGLADGKSGDVPDARKYNASALVSKLALKTLSALLARMSKDEIAERGERVAPALVRGMAHSSVIVRKAVVGALVAMHRAGGDAVLPLYAGLTASQRQLFEIYAAKARKAPASAPKARKMAWAGANENVRSPRNGALAARPARGKTLGAI